MINYTKQQIIQHQADVAMQTRTGIYNSVSYDEIMNNKYLKNAMGF